MASDRSAARSEGGRDDAALLEPADLLKLLCRGLSRLAVAAQGIDERLDGQLARLRQILRSDIGRTPELAAVIDAIDDRIKHVDEDRGQRIAALQQALELLVQQLLVLKPERPLARELKSFLKQLGPALGGGEELALLSRLASLQGQALAQAPRGAGLLARWFGGEQRGEVAAAPPPATDAAIAAAMPPASEEPPFSRISASVCAVLAGLLRQIEPPPAAADNHRQAREQIERGLDGHELVPALEQTSLVVLAALERDRAAFQQFLLGLNQRMAAANQALHRSLQTQAECRRADAVLDETVRGQVAAIQAGVSAAAELEQLKAEVSSRLDSIVSAMDHHRHEEPSRQRALEQQLALLTERVRDMEAHSAQVEARFEQQRRLALIDVLTQMPNRQAYEERLQEEYQRWLRYRRPLALVVCDIDNFKSVNDNFGHSAGDKVLRIIARTLRTRLRQADFVARFGGEEFVALMPETGVQEALKTMEGIRAAIAECPFHFRAEPVSITLSAGIAGFVEGDAPDAVFDRADAALYRAKQAGRNRCVCDAPPPG